MSQQHVTARVRRWCRLCQTVCTLSWSAPASAAVLEALSGDLPPLSGDLPTLSGDLPPLAACILIWSATTGLHICVSCADRVPDVSQCDVICCHGLLARFDQQGMWTCTSLNNLVANRCCSWLQQLWRSAAGRSHCFVSLHM